MSTLGNRNALMDPLLNEMWPLVTQVQSSVQKATLTKVLGLIPGDMAWKKPQKKHTKKNNKKQVL